MTTDLDQPAREALIDAIRPIIVQGFDVAAFADCTAQHGHTGLVQITGPTDEDAALAFANFAALAVIEALHEAFPQLTAGPRASA